MHEGEGEVKFKQAPSTFKTSPKTSHITERYIRKTYGKVVCKNKCELPCIVMHKITKCYGNWIELIYGRLSVAQMQAGYRLILTSLGGE